MLEWYAKGIPIAFNAQVKEIQWSPETGVKLSTTKGEVYHAQKCVVTIPIGVLQQNEVKFQPPLSEAKKHSIQAMQMLPATKLFYLFNRTDLWPQNMTYMAHTGLTARWWTPFYGKQSDKLASMCAYITAERARILDQMPAEEALNVGLTELAQLLNVPKALLEKHCILQKRISWANDPFARGGYALVPPHAEEARVELAKPEGNTLFFAGEATCYDTNPQTVHGALESGWRAAKQVMDFTPSKL